MNDENNLNYENNGFTPEETNTPEEKPQEPDFSRYVDNPTDEPTQQSYAQNSGSQPDETENVPPNYSQYSGYAQQADGTGNVPPRQNYSQYANYGEQPKNNPEESAYSPYSSRPYSQQYSQQGQPYVDTQAEPEQKKKTSKGFKAFIIALIAIILCVAIVLAVYPKISEKNGTENSTKVSDSTKITLNESPKSSSKDSVTAQEIAEQSKKFNVGILLYASSQQFMSSQTGSSLAGEGSGIIMSEDSTGTYTYILTCAHVISSAKSSDYDITVQDYENNTYEATIVGFDTKTDIGLLKIKATGLTCAEFGDSSTLAIGQTVYAIGNPGGTEFFGSFTNGIISSIDRPISSESGYEMECIQHTTPINSGNSGGALMNEYGQVIGINSSKIVSTGYEGMAFSIPISDAKPIIDDIIANGYVTNRPKLGIKYAAASQYQQYALIIKLKDLPAGSLVIAKINSDSSLANTDAEVGDLITAVNGEKLDSADVLLEKIENGKVGDKLELTMCRINDDYSTKEFKVTATLVEDTGTDSGEDEEQTTQNYWEEYFKQFGGY